MTERIRYETSTLLWQPIDASTDDVGCLAINKFFDWPSPQFKTSPNPQLVANTSGQSAIYPRGRCLIGTAMGRRCEWRQHTVSDVTAMCRSCEWRQLLCAGSNRSQSVAQISRPRDGSFHRLLVTLSLHCPQHITVTNLCIIFQQIKWLNREQVADVLFVFTDICQWCADGLFVTEHEYNKTSHKGLKVESQ